MDERGISLLEGKRAEATTPIAESAKELKELRNEVRRIDYSDVVLKETLVELPKTVKELHDKLDETVDKFVYEDKDELKHKENVPQTVVRKFEDEKFWESVGWAEADRERVKTELQGGVLQLGKERAEVVMHMLIGSGKRASEVLAILKDVTKFDHYKTNEEEGKKISDTQQKLLYLTEELGLGGEMNETYIKRFVMDDVFRRELDEEYDGALPQNLFDLAWNIGYRENPEKYGIHGQFPLLQMQVHKYRDEKGIERVKGRYVVNQANLIRWLRERMYNRWDVFETDEVPDFFSIISINKGPLATINLGTLIFDKERYFRDETGHLWENLWGQVMIEPWMLLWERKYAVDYYNAIGSEEELAKAYKSMGHLSKFTRKVNGMSMLDRSLALPVDFKGKGSDSKLGEAILSIYLAYFNLADFDMLQEVLGADSDFFTRDGWIKAAQEVFRSPMLAATGSPSVENFFGDREELFNKAFDTSGNVTEKQKKDFIKFINPYYQEFPPQTIIKVLRKAIENAVRDRVVSKESKNKDEEIDESAINYAWLKAFSWSYFTGVLARNNFPNVSGHAAETKWLYTEAYRRKYETFGGAGNPYTVPMFKQLSIPFFEGTLAEGANEHYIAGYNKDGSPKLEKRQLTQMEIMKRMQQAVNQFQSQRRELKGQLEQARRDKDSARIENLQKQITRLDDVSSNWQKTHASQLEFNDNAMKIYANNLIGRAKELYEQVMKGMETDFEKFTKYDSVFRGVSFEREEWQKAMQDKLITPLRYLFEANGATQLNQRVRSPIIVGRDKEGKLEWEWREMYLGEAMLAHQIVDIPQFRTQVKELSGEEWAELQRKGYRKRGKFVVRPDGKHLIDYNKVQNDKPLVYKQWMLMKIAGDLWAHIDRHSTDPAYGLDHYLNVLDAIKSLSGDLEGTEYDMRGVRIIKPFFSKAQIEWLRKISGTSTVRLYGKALLTDIFTGDREKKRSVFGESATTILRGVFKGS